MPTVRHEVCSQRLASYGGKADMPVTGKRGRTVRYGGKTTLAKKIKEAVPGSHFLCQDDYFFEEGSPQLVIDPELNHANWESLEALDMDRMLADLTSHLNTQEKLLQSQPAKSPHLVFVEGFTIFNYRPFNSLWSKKYFITLDKEEAQRRRSGRIYDPPDCPGYFDKFVWPMYEKHKAELNKEHADIVYMDGRANPDENYNRLLKDVTMLIANAPLLITQER